MRLTVLGSSGGFPTAENPSTGYAVEHDGFTILLDAGYGTFAAMLKHIPPGAVDAVLISHGHPDHCADLNPLLRARAMADLPLPALPLYSLPEALDAVLALDRPGMLDSAYDARHFAAGESFSAGPFTVDTRPLPHSRPNAGFRLSAGGTTLVYTGDTGPSPLLLDLAQGADILIAEATYPEYVPPPNTETLSSALQAGQLAASAKVGNLILTHLWPGESQTASLAAARRSYDGPIEVAAP